ncbi:MAG: Ubiquitin-conjugating enzyme E2 G2, partial [Paramarteilia canceri]
MTGDGRELRRAIARLRKESAEMSDASGSASCEGLVANFKSPDNVFDWEAYIQGPEGSFFEYGVFKASLKFKS